MHPVRRIETVNNLEAEEGFMDKYQLTYHVDMVLCIDASGSMRHVIDLVKDSALHFYRERNGRNAEKE